jgi:hypothetical protein
VESARGTGGPVQWYPGSKRTRLPRGPGSMLR